ncbi:MAG: hypothetical protein ACXABY_25580 [Candidatus Thorarchaeota archaeon]|jgi:hypothetical protein
MSEATAEVKTDEGTDGIRENILHILSIFPIISPSMLHITLGGSLPTKVWKPILEALITSGLVERGEHVTPAPNGRTRCYTLLSLSSKPL